MAWVPGSRSKFGNWTSVPPLHSWNIAECDVKPQSTTGSRSVALSRVFDLQLGGGGSSDRDNSQSSGLVTRNSNVKYESPLLLDLKAMPNFYLFFSFLVSHTSTVKRSCHMEYTCENKATSLLVWKLWSRLKFFKSKSNFKIKVTMSKIIRTRQIIHIVPYIQTVLSQYKNRLLLRCIHYFKSDLINNMDHMRIWGT